MAVTVEELQILFIADVQDAMAKTKQLQKSINKTTADIMKPVKTLNESVKKASSQSADAVARANARIAEANAKVQLAQDKMRASASKTQAAVDKASAASAKAQEAVRKTTESANAAMKRQNEILDAQKASVARAKDSRERLAKIIASAATVPAQQTVDAGPLYPPKTYTDTYAPKRPAAQPQQPRAPSAPDLTMWTRITAQANAKLDFLKQKLYNVGLYGKEAGTKTAKALSSVAQPAEHAAKVIKRVGDSAKSTSRSGFNLGKMLRGMLMYRAVSGVMNAIRDGMQNMAQGSRVANATLSSLASSFLYLKNSIAAAFMPALQALLPIITVITNALANLMNMIAAVTSRLFGGSSTFVKAKKVQTDYAASLGKTGAAAKKAGEDAKGALASFDELNVIEKQAGGADAGGGGGAGALNPADMFETVEIPASVIDVVDAIKQKATEIAVILKSGFDAGYINADFEQLKKTISSVGDRLRSIFTAPEVKDAARHFGASWVRNLGVVTGALGSIGTNLGQMLMGGLDQYLASNSRRIKEWIVSTFNVSAEISDIVGQITISFADVFSVFGGANAQKIVADFLTTFGGALMTITELGAKIGRDTLRAITAPLTQNTEQIKTAIQSLLSPILTVMDSVANAATKIFDKIRKTYDQNISPMFEAFGDGFAQISTAVLDAWNQHIAPVLQQLADRFSQIVDKSIRPLAESFIENFGKISDIVKTVWISVIVPFLSWFTSNFVTRIGSGLSTVGNAFLTILETATGVMSGILTVLGGLLEFIAGAFSGDWDKAWNGIKNIFSGFAKAIGSVFRGAVNVIVDAVNWLLRLIPEKVNGLIRSVNGIASNVGISVSIPEVLAPQIPRLANGGVLSTETAFVGGEYAGASSNPEIVAPQSIMRETFLDAVWPLVDAVLEGTGDVRKAIEDKDTNLAVDGVSLERSLQKPRQRVSRQRGSSLITG